MESMAVAQQLAEKKKVGRPAGGMNREKIGLRNRIRRYEPKLIHRLLRIALEGENEAVSLAAIGMLLDRGYGKPTQTIEGTGAAIAISIVTNAAIGNISDAVAIEGNKDE